MHARTVTFGIVSAALLIAAGAPVADAAEGVFAIRAGDRVDGVLEDCGERHVLRLELVRGEVFRMRVRSAQDVAADITLQIYGPDGTLVNPEAGVRAVNTGSRLGPFRVTESGTYDIQLSTVTRHHIPYKVTSSVRKRRARAVPLRRGHARRVVAASGSRLRLRGGANAALELTPPRGETVAVSVGSAEHDALRGAGLAAPVGGTYLVTATGRARLIVQPPGRRARRTLEFPALPPNPERVSAWYDEAGWVSDPRVVAPPDHQPPSSAGGREPAPPPNVSLTDRPSAGLRSLDLLPLADTTHSGGPNAGVGLPLAPPPSLADAVRDGEVVELGTGPAYVYSVPHTDFGTLTYTVRFAVGGVSSLAPLPTETGRVTLRWSVTSTDSPSHTGEWSFTVDPLRSVEVLDGTESWVGPASRLVQSSSSALTAPFDGGPVSGRAVLVLDSNTHGAFRRVEEHDGLGETVVTVE